MRGCGKTRRWLLRADLGALAEALEARTRATGPGRHLAACPACRSAARRILAGTEALDRALAALDPGEREKAAGPRESPPDEPRAAPAGDGGRERSRGWIAAAALAAVVAGLLLLWPEPQRSGAPETSSRPEGGDRTAAAPVVPAADIVQVRAPERGRLAVFETREPAMTVVWFLPPRANETEPRR